MQKALPGRVLVLCPSCGESLTADAAYDEAVCPFCSARFRVSEGRRALETQGTAPGARPAPPRRKKHTFRWLLVCAVFFLLGRMVLPGLVRTALKERRTEPDRTLSAPAASAPRPAAMPGPGVTPKPTSIPTPTPAPTSAPRAAGVSPEFKQYMDSCEAFFDEYLAFMASMDEEGDGFGVLLRYAEMMERYAEVMDSMDAIDEEELSTADEIYYLEVLSRINRKLLEASAED